MGFKIVVLVLVKSKNIERLFLSITSKEKNAKSMKSYLYNQIDSELYNYLVILNF